MKNWIALLCSTAMLAGCGGMAEDEIKPGKWKMSAGMTDMEVPGMTDDQAASMKEAMGEMMSQEQCVTAQEARFDPAELGDAFTQGGDCTIGEFDLTDGKIDGTMTCKMPDGNSVDTDIKGTLEPEAFSMSATTVLVQDILPEGKANMTIEVKGERIGDC